MAAEDESTSQTTSHAGHCSSILPGTAATDAKARARLAKKGKPAESTHRVTTQKQRLTTYRYVVKKKCTQEQSHCSLSNVRGGREQHSCGGRPLPIYEFYEIIYHSPSATTHYSTGDIAAHPPREVRAQTGANDSTTAGDHPEDKVKTKQRSLPNRHVPRCTVLSQASCRRRCCCRHTKTPSGLYSVPSNMKPMVNSWF